MKFLLFNDLHLSDKPPRWRTEEYTNDLFDKLDQIIDIREKAGCTVVACGGDLFHNPHPARVSHALVSRFIDWLDRLDCMFAIAPGNHDMSSGGLDTIDRQPIGVVARHPGVQLLCSGERGSTISDSASPESGYRPLVGGREWRYDCDADFLLEAASDQINVLITHAPIAREPNPFYTTVQPEQLAGQFSAVCFGHLHPPEDPYVINGTTFLNPGALSRGSLTPSDLDRIPSVFIVEATAAGAITVERVALRVRPHDQIFRTDIAQVEKTANEAVERFVTSLGSAVLDSVDLTKLKEIALGMCHGDSSLANLASDILDQVEE